MGLMALLVFLNALPLLSCDMYLAAMPSMGEEFQASTGTINLTLVVFFLLMAASMLVWGPLSDKYGRKPMLLGGLITYIAGSVLCVVAGGVYELIAFRALQAIGSGAMMAVSIAVTKDVYTGRQRERALAAVGAVMALAPVVGPVLGTAVIVAASWRAVFGVLAVLGVVGLVGCAWMRETIQERSKQGILGTVSRLGVVLGNPVFGRLIGLFSLMAVPMFGYIGLASAIFITRYGLSEQLFSVFFGLNAVLFLAGPVVYFPLQRWLGRVRVVTMCLVAAIISGVVMLLFGRMGPIAFSLCVAPGSLCVSILRTPSMHFMLEQQEGDTGVASSLITAGFALFGSAGLALLSLDLFSDKILVMGAAYGLAGIVSLVTWLSTTGRLVVPQERRRSDVGVEGSVLVGEADGDG